MLILFWVDVGGILFILPSLNPDPVFLNIIPVDVHAQSRMLGNVDESFVIHGFAVFVKPGCVFVEVDERVEEAAFVKFAVGHGAQGVQVAGTASVDFAAHAKGFAQVNGFHQGCQTAHIADAAARNITGTGFDPFSAHIHFAFACFGTTYW